ncbi:MAG: flagellar assembly protein FliW [Nitrospira sp.]|nr:flagellar assembly protein FliW [Nitrospira sp.]
MKLYTKRFGEIEIEEAKIIHFPHGILGFPDVKRYIVLNHLNKPDIPFKWLQAIDNPDLAFVITDPVLFYPEYAPVINQQDLRELGISNLSERGIIAIVTIPQGAPEKMTANLQGPVVVNLTTREAKQVVLTGEEYQVRSPLLGNTANAVLSKA